MTSVNYLCRSIEQCQYVLHSPARVGSHDRSSVQCRTFPKPVALRTRQRALSRSIRASSGKTPPGGPGGGNSKDTAGAGLSWVSPDWLTSLVQKFRGPDLSGIPVADAKLEDVKDLLGGALFLPLFKWMLESGPVYRSDYSRFPCFPRPRQTILKSVHLYHHLIHPNNSFFLRTTMAGSQRGHVIS